MLVSCKIERTELELEFANQQNPNLNLGAAKMEEAESNDASANGKKLCLLSTLLQVCLCDLCVCARV